ncbi:MAG: alpha-hydroxy acid oxidase, partial [Pseudomonadota bacterium]|nr:alpha-hydroxy acid oxidase [Pseudomonadota bacterium]
GIPFTLSTVAAESIETVAADHAAAGGAPGGAWFQLYAPTQAEMRRDLVARAQAAGAGALVVTVDVPVGSRRERQRRARVAMPPALSLGLALDLARRPAWVAATLRHGIPRFANLLPYASPAETADITAFLRTSLSHAITRDHLAELRDLWSGPLVVKGLMHPEDAVAAADLGADAVWVSNHGARQLDLAPAAIDALPGVVSALAGRVPVLFDSGLRSGADVARAVALGADMCFLGRAFAWGVCALGAPGAAHAIAILREELASVMTQTGCVALSELRDRL